MKNLKSLLIILSVNTFQVGCSQQANLQGIIPESANILADKSGYNLVFSSGPTSVNTGSCDGSFVVTRVYPRNGNPAPVVAGTVLVILGGNGNGHFYSDSSCTNAISAITIANRQSSTPAFYFKDSSAQNLQFSGSFYSYGVANLSVVVEGPSPSPTPNPTPNPTPTPFPTPSPTPSSCPTGSGNHVYCTNFQHPENPLSDGGNWIDGKSVGIDWNDVKTTSGYAQEAASPSSTSGFDDGTAILTGTWGADQTAQIVARAPKNLGGTQEVEIRLRSSLSAHNCTGYEVDWTTGGLGLVRWNGRGPFTWQYGWTTLASANVKYADGDILKASIIGTLITVYRNGSVVLTHDTAGDSAPTDGSGGAARYSTGNPGFGIDINSTTVDVNFGISEFSATSQ